MAGDVRYLLVSEKLTRNSLCTISPVPVSVPGLCLCLCLSLTGVSLLLPRSVQARYRLLGVYNVL